MRPTGRQIQGAVKQTTHAQFRAARAMLNWTFKEAAAAIGALVMSVRRAESEGLSLPSPALLRALHEAYEQAGVELIPEYDGGAGVRLRQQKDGDA